MRSNLFVIIFISLFITNTFSQTENDKSNSITTETKKDFPGKFYFYFKQKVGFEEDLNQIYASNLKNELDLCFSLPLNIYTFDIWVNDLFLTDIVPVINGYYTSPIDLFYNSLTFAQDNKFRIKKVMDVFLNFELGINTPFYDETFLIFNPVLKLKGDYFFGFLWEIEQSFPLEFYPADSSMIFFSSTYTKIGYEFFRFYGPRNFRLSILFEDTFIYSSPFPFNSENYIENRLQTGLLFDVYKIFMPSIYFVYNIIEYMDIQILDSYLIGLKTGFILCKKFFSVNFDYTGTIDINYPASLWHNRFDLYIKFSFSN